MRLPKRFAWVSTALLLFRTQRRQRTLLPNWIACLAFMYGCRKAMIRRMRRERLINR